MSDGGAADRRRLCIVATVPFAINVFMRAHIGMLKVDYDVTVVTSGSSRDLGGILSGRVSFIPLRIERKISPWRDVLTLIRLWHVFRREKFDSVHSIMPKSGLLSMLAARLAGVPLRFHTFTGQVWANKKGPRRSLLKCLDKVLVMNATRVIADSHSQRLFLINNHVAKPSEIVVLAEGSVAGVDLTRFAYRAEIRSQIRAQHSIPSGAIVFVFLGRLNRDKGLMNLARAFKAAAGRNTSIHLLIVGPDEDRLEVEFAELAQVVTGRVHRVGFTESPESYLSASDVICLPSYREGFGAVIIEAAAVGLPAIASRIYGITDAVEDGVTGILHQPTSDREIADAMVCLASNEKLRRQMGDAARARVTATWSEARVTKALADFYRDMFATVGATAR